MIDVHCHLTESRIFDNLGAEIFSARKCGIEGFISSALCKKEFEAIESPAFAQFENCVSWSAGIHPIYEENAVNYFDDLVKLCDEKKIIAIGEIGLDGRKNNANFQEKILLEQLALAQNYNLPVVFHCVKKHYELYKLLKNNFPKFFGFLHGFKASKEIAEKFSEFDLAFSIGSILPKNEVIQHILKRGFFLFETDAPYQESSDSKDDFNHLKNLILTVEKIDLASFAELKNKQKKSFKNIFGDVHFGE